MMDQAEADLAVFVFPENYPEVLEQMGQVVGRKLMRHGMSFEQASAAAFDIAEGIRTEVGGANQYIPRGIQFDLSLRDEKIYAEFNGKNYFALARKWHLSEMQIRNVVKAGLRRDRLRRQTVLPGIEPEPVQPTRRG